MQHMVNDLNNNSTSHQRYASRYFNPVKAARYAGKQNETRTHAREIRCIERALGDLPAGSRVLDLPCGAARLLPDLLRMGFDVTAADVAPPMLEQAKKYAGSLNLEDRVHFVLADALDTGFADDEFDGLVCNRLFHHFNEPEVRIKGLREFARITKQSIVISFFCNLSLDALTFHLADRLRPRKSTDRIPISLGEIKRNAAVAGLRVDGIFPTRAGISRQWYLRLKLR